MIPTGRQIREGRHLTGMSELDLAMAAGVGLELVIRAELVDSLPLLRKRDSIAIQKTLEAAGIEFIPENGGGAGVRLRKVEN